MAELTCPKCQSPMRSYERNGVTVDQCSGCRGVFLDRGELERLVDAESAYYEAQTAAAPPPIEQQRQQYREPERQQYSQPEPRREKGMDLEDMAGRLLGGKSHGSSYGQSYGSHGKRKKKSFLDELFD